MSDGQYKVSISILAKKTSGTSGVHEFITREFKIEDTYSNQELEEMVANLTPAYTPENMKD